ncbi:hypothetical protein ACO0LG_17465 [Undibacterium sp. Ji42W]|uniref:hypothetical protein n=1 Tax=Undibacterium sp. Ji42W TaxID=3413039 RepID=UPI003BF2688B
MLFYLWAQAYSGESHRCRTATSNHIAITLHMTGYLQGFDFWPGDWYLQLLAGTLRLHMPDLLSYF